MTQRIIQIMRSLQMNQRDFAKEIGISASSLSSILNGHTSPTNNIVQAIHRRFPDISITWLMFGEGEMKVDDAANTTPAQIEGESVRPSAPTEPTATMSDAVPSIQSTAADGSIPGQVVIRETVKYVDKPQRKITEIRVFYDDGTFDTFSGGRD